MDTVWAGLKQKPLVAMETWKMWDELGVDFGSAMSIRARATAAINATVNAGIKAFWSDYGFSGSNTSGGGVYGSGSHRVPDQVRRYRNTDAAESSLIAAAVEFKGREMRNIRFVAQRLRRGEWEAVDHPVNDILKMPNPLYSSSGLNLATSWDMTLFGDGYWRTERNARGIPVSLHWMPQPQVRLQPREWRPGIETTYIYQPSHGAGRMTLVRGRRNPLPPRHQRRRPTAWRQPDCIAARGSRR